VAVGKTYQQKSREKEFGVCGLDLMGLPIKK